MDTDPVVDETIKTKETITSSVNIIEGLNVTYQAGASITLTDGFYVENGASFHAFIEDCGTTSVNENKVLTTRTSTAIEHFHKKAISNTLAVKVYPNPFSNSTAIEYILSEASPVVVKIIDLTGQTVATLVNSTIQQAGEYQLTWQNEAAISGTLLLYIQNNTEVIVEKMVVIK